MRLSLFKVLLVITSLLGANATLANDTLPDNAWGTASKWYCNDGYKKVSNTCVALEMPANAWAYGDNWYCKTGYVISGQQCVRPEHLPTVSVDYYQSPISSTAYKPITSPYTTPATPTNNASDEDGVYTPAFGTSCAENGSCYGDISTATGRPKTVAVKGYRRSDGTYVRGHYRSKPKN